MDASAVRLGRVSRVLALGAAQRESFERLFEAEYSRVVRVAQRVLDDPAAAEDVAQEVFLSFYRSQPPNAPYAAAWLHAAAGHAALNTIRGRKRRAAREAAARSDEAADPEGEVIRSERRAEVRDALARLPVRGATLLVLRYSGLSYAECAAALGVGANQIGTLLRRAEEAFKREVTGDG